MRRVLSCALTLASLLALAAPVRADILWEPMDNSFFENHRAECSYENRSYYANSPDGFVTAWDAPRGSMVRAQYENGESLWVGYTYGNDWALISRWDGGGETSGWIPLAELALIYDNISFSEEYADRIAPYNGEFADYTGTPEGSAYGVLKDCRNPLASFLPVRTKIQNLLLTGQSINLHGCLGTTITAVSTCAELVGTEYLTKKIAHA